MHLGTRSIGKPAPKPKGCCESSLRVGDDGRDSPIREAVMAPRRRIKKLAVLVDTTPEVLVEIMGDVFSETINELQMYKPRACGRIARDIPRRAAALRGADTGR
jgi:hypothetical protein